MPVCDRLSGRWEARRHMLMIGAGLMTGLIGVGCAVDPPQVPRITIPFFISVANDTTTVLDVASDRSDFLQTGADSSLSLNFDAEFGESSRQEVGEDRLAVSPSPASFATELGDITIEGQEDLDPPPVRLGEVLPSEVFAAAEAAAALGGDFTLPATDLEIPPVPMSLPNVTSLTVIEGGLRIRITNGFPVELARLEIKLNDLGNQSVPAKSEFSKVVFDPVGVGEPSDFKLLLFNPDDLLEGNEISGNLELVVVGATAEATNPPLDEDAVLTIEVDLLQLTVSKARAVIEPKTFTDRQVLGFPDSRIRVSEAVIREGELTLIVTNNIPVIMSVSLTLPDLTLDEVPATFLIPELIADASTPATFILDKYIFAPNDPDAIEIIYSASTFPSETEVTIESGGTIAIEAQPQRLAFDTVRGILDNLELPIEPVSRTVDFPKGLGNLSLDEAFLRVLVTTAVGITSFMDLVITGFDSDGDPTPDLRITHLIKAASPGNEQQFPIDISSDSLTAFLNALPTEITVTPTVRIGDGKNVDVIEPDHWVQVDSVNFRAPARFKILSDTRIEPTPDFREFADEEARKRISNNLLFAEVITEISNHLPIGVKVSLRAAKLQADVYSDSPTDSVLVVPAKQEEGQPLDDVDFFNVANAAAFGVDAGRIDENGRVIEATPSTQAS